jgi:hypothetical protein
MQSQSSACHDTQKRMMAASPRLMRVVTHFDFLLMTIAGIDRRIPVGNEGWRQSRIHISLADCHPSAGSLSIRSTHHAHKGIFPTNPAVA